MRAEKKSQGIRFVNSGGEQNVKVWMLLSAHDSCGERCFRRARVRHCVDEVRKRSSWVKECLSVDCAR